MCSFIILTNVHLCFQDVALNEPLHNLLNSVISKLLINPDVVIIKNTIPLPRALKVFVCKDIADPRKPMKVFIDVSEIIVQDKDGNYRMMAIDKLIAYLTSAMTHMVYNAEPTRIINNVQAITSARNGFCQMVTYIIDYLYKISNTDITKDMCKHVTAMYFDINILKKDPESNAENIRQCATKISKLNEIGRAHV